jgi:DNA-binding transcriptional LysR family regulator
MLDIAQLRSFARIADLGSVSGAARSLGLPKSSVSRALSRLEETLRTALIERSTRHLRLTDAGRLLHRHAQRILDDVSEAENAVGSLIGRPSGTLRVSVGFTFAAGPLAPMLPAFLASYPDMRVVLTVDNRPVDLLTEEVDVSIRIGPLRDSELIARKLGTIELWPCASPAYLAAHGTPKTVDDLLKHSLIAHTDRRIPWRIRTPSGAMREIDTEPRTVIPEPAVTRVMLLGDAGIGWLPDFNARDCISNGTLVRVLPDHGVDVVDVHALYPSHRSLSAKVRVFIDALATHLAGHRLLNEVKVLPTTMVHSVGN